jgi:3-oxoadipate CoA-transferase alpha subunit
MATVVSDADRAVSGIQEGSTVLIGGFGPAGQPVELIEALIRGGVTDLTVVSNNAGNGRVGLAALLANGQVRKIICSFPRQADSYVFDELYRADKVELELVPQGNLAERMRAAGAGIGAFYSPPESEHLSPKARNGAPSMAAITSWSIRSRAMSR